MSIQLWISTRIRVIYERLGLLAVSGWLMGWEPVTPGRVGKERMLAFWAVFGLLSAWRGETGVLVQKPAAAPRYLRAVAYDYHFTSLAERRQTGAWWKREPKGLYLPALSVPPQPRQ